MGVALITMESMPRLDFFQAFLVAHAEPLLLIDDDESNVFPFDILRKQAVGTNGEVDFALAKVVESGF